MKRAPALSLWIAIYLLFGTNALQAAEDPRATQLTYEPWIKLCPGDLDCFVTSGARGACFPSGGGLSIIVTDQERSSLSAHLATRRPLEGAISVQIDQGDPILILHPECSGPVCGGKMQIGGDFIEHLKRSQTITIEATDTTHRKNSLSLPLAGFAQALDGPEAALSKFMEEGQQKLRAERARPAAEQKKLECEE
jgi:invasion protein IalB